MERLRTFGPCSGSTLPKLRDTLKEAAFDFHDPESCHRLHMVTMDVARVSIE